MTYPSARHDPHPRVTLRPGIDVIVERAHHWSEYDPGDRDKTLWAGFTVTLPGGNLYFAGDTGPGDMRWATQARAAGPVRLAILPIGAYHFEGHETDNHIGPDQAVTAFEQLGTAYAIGVHLGTFELTSEGINEAPDHLRAALVREHIPANRFRTPEAGEPWVIEQKRVNPPPPGGGVAEGDGGGGHGTEVAFTSPAVWQEPATSPWRGRIERSNTALPSS